MSDSDPKSSPAKQKPSVSPTPNSFGLVATAVFEMRGELGKQSQLCETLDRHYMEQREDIRTLEKLVEDKVRELTTTMNKVTLTMKFGWALLLTIGGAVVWMSLRIWEVLLPALQLKLGLPTK